MATVVVKGLNKLGWIKYQFLFMVRGVH